MSKFKSNRKARPSDILRRKAAREQAAEMATQADIEAKLKKYAGIPIREWDYPRIVLAIPLERSISYASDTFFQFLGIAQTGIPILNFPYGRTDLVRNKMALSLLQSDFTHLLMLDIDHIHPIDIAHRLGKWVIANPDIKVVGGLNFRRSAPYDPCCFIRGEDGGLYPPVVWDQGLIEVDAIGTGSILISKEVFTQIEPPWFYNDYSMVMSDQWPGEDMGFSKLCNDAGIPLYVDTTTTSPHLAHGAIDETSFRQYVAEHNLPVSYIDQKVVDGSEELAEIEVGEQAFDTNSSIELREPQYPIKSEQPIDITEEQPEPKGVDGA